MNRDPLATLIALACAALGVLMLVVLLYTFAVMVDAANTQPCSVEVCGP